MDGKALLYSLRQRLDEVDGSGQLDEFSSYQFLYDAASEFVKRTGCLHSTATISTVANQAAYTLPSDYLRPYLRDSQHRYYLKINDGTTDTFVYFADYESIYLANNTTAQPLPDGWTVSDQESLSNRLSSTATANGAASGGESTLTDSTANFSSVSAGDVVHNTTDGSDGLVVSVTSTTALVTALFGGTNSDWTTADAYVIQPQGRMEIIFDPAPSVSGYTVSFPYVQKPAPVFSDYRLYRFPQECMRPIVTYALFNYKYRDRAPNYGDKLFQYWDREVRMYADSINRSFARRDFRVNLRKRRS